MFYLNAPGVSRSRIGPGVDFDFDPDQDGRRTLEHIAEQLRLDGLIQHQPDLDRLWLQPA